MSNCNNCTKCKCPTKKEILLDKPLTIAELIDSIKSSKPLSEEFATVLSDNVTDLF